MKVDIELKGGRILEDLEVEDPNDIAAAAKIAIDKGLAKPTDFPEKYRPSFSLNNLRKNYPRSYLSELAGLYRSVMDLSGTGEALRNLASGGISKLVNKITPGAGAAIGLDPENVKVADAFGQDFMNKYGSMDDYLSYLEHNPAGAASDISLALTLPSLPSSAAGLTGKTVGAAGKIPRIGAALKLPQTAAALGKVSSALNPLPIRVLGQVGAGFDPLNLGGNLIGALPTWAGKTRLPSSAYANATGLNTTQSKFALAEDVLANDAGLATLQARQAPIVNEIQSRLGAIKQKLPAEDLLENVYPLEQKLSTNNLNYVNDINEYDRVVNDRLAALERKPMLSAQDLQDYKLGAYENVYPKTGNMSVSDQIDEAIGQKARNTLENWDPEIGAANLKLAPYQDILPDFKKAVEHVKVRGGGISPTEMIPLTIAGSTAGWKGLATSGLITALSRPSGRAWMARELARKGKKRGYGFAENRVLQAILQESAREVQDLKSLAE